MARTCQKCDRRIRSGQLCQQCHLDERYGQGVGVNDDTTATTERRRGECGDCGNEYEWDGGMIACPECGHYGVRNTRDVTPEETDDIDRDETIIADGGSRTITTCNHDIDPNSITVVAGPNRPMGIEGRCQNEGCGCMLYLQVTVEDMVAYHPGGGA